MEHKEKRCGLRHMEKAKFLAAAKSSRQGKENTFAPISSHMDTVWSLDPVSATMISSANACTQERQRLITDSSSLTIMQTLTVAIRPLLM